MLRMGLDKVISFLPYGKKFRRQRKMMMQHLTLRLSPNFIRSREESFISC